MLLYDLIYWDFGGDVGQLAPATPGALLKKPKDDEWVLRELPDAADTGDSTDKPPDQSKNKPSDEATDESTKRSIDKSAKGSINESTDESSDKSSNESSKADPKEGNASEVIDPKFYAAAKSLQHLCEQEFHDLSKEYYIHPTVKKLLEFHWNMRSRKGKKIADPRFPYAAEQRFMTVDGVSEFIDPEFLPAPPPPEPLSKLEFLDLVNERTTKREPGERPFKRPISLRTAELFGIPRKTYDSEQPAIILRRHQVAKVK